MYNSKQIAKQLVKIRKDESFSDERMEEIIDSYFQSLVDQLLPAVINIREESYSDTDLKLRIKGLANASGIEEERLRKPCTK